MVLVENGEIILYNTLNYILIYAEYIIMKFYVTLEKFIDNGWLHSFADIYKLADHMNDIITMDGFGKKSYQNLTSTVTYTKKMEPSTNQTMTNYSEKMDGLTNMTGNPNILFLKQIC